MTQEFRFPIPSRDRVVLIAVGLMGTGLVVGVLVLVARMSADFGLSMVELTGRSTQLRAALVGLVLVHGLASVLGVHHMRRWARTEVRFDDTEGFVRFRQPGALPGVAATELGFAVDGIEGLTLTRRRVGAAQRVELHVVAGRDTLRLPLQHVLESPRRTRGSSPGAWRDHPVVLAFTERTGRDVIVD